MSDPARLAPSETADPQTLLHLALRGDEQKAHGDLEGALASYRELLHFQPGHAEAHACLASIFAEQRRLDDAVRSYQEALRLKPDWPAAFNNLGAAFAEQGRFDLAEASYRQAIRLAPDFVAPHCNLSHMLLLREEFDEGWAEYEWRWHQQSTSLPVFGVPRWDGAPLAGRTILLGAEQGLGDTIHFLRYASLVQQQGGTVVFECPSALLSLAATCAGIDRLVTRGEPLPAFDLHAPLLSLPGIFRTTRLAIPAQVPYLAADPSRVEHWRRELASEPRFKVGIVWQGNPAFSRDRQRSIPLAEFAELAKLDGVALYSLQVGQGSDPLATSGLPITDLGSRFDPASLADLAAVLVNVDLLITVDTAPAHLAGALGVPVWVALPVLADWRWMLGRSDSPWYPSMRLFRQQRPDDWQPVLEQMVQELRRASEGGPREKGVRTLFRPGQNSKV
jgi:hypothetical protein